jgi:uncharacterized protein YjbI with pentapeptide repeats
MIVGGELSFQEDSEAVLPAGAAFAHADLADADLAHADLAHADLAHADLAHADLQRTGPIELLPEIHVG